MNTSQLVWVATLALASAVPACSRAETESQTRRAAAEVKSAAATAGEHLADGWLTTKVQAQYFADRDIKARYINVSTLDGVVTLTGYVDSDASRQQAVQIARNTDGVREVTDRLAIGRIPDSGPPPAPSTSPSPGTAATSGIERSADRAVARVDDARITTTIQAKYFMDGTVKGRNIDVDTSGAVVTLSGEVGSETERGRALVLARETEGVQRVEDHLAVNAALASADVDAASAPDAAAAPSLGERIDDGVITAKVKASLIADSQVKATTLDVSTTNGVVTLDGVQPTATAKQRALTIARATDGVSQVVDKVSVKR